MERKRSARRSRATLKVTGKKALDGAAEGEESERTLPLASSSPKKSEQLKNEVHGEQLPAPVLSPPPPPSSSHSEDTPKLSKRAMKRMHVWEPVIKPPEDLDSVPLCGVPRANVVWLDNNTRVTLIPNNNSGVHTRRGAASLAAATELPTSYLVYTKDPLTRVGRVVDQEVRVITGLSPGEDPRSILRKVSLTSLATRRNSASSTRELDAGSSNLSTASGRVGETGPDGTEDGGEEGIGADENDDNSDVNGSSGDEDEKKSGPDDVSASSMPSLRMKKRKKIFTTEEAQSVRHRETGVGNNKRRKCVSEKKLDDTTKKTQPARVTAASAAQAMLPPPYRRNRRLKRKMHITEETPVFAAHSELRDRMPRLFPKAPFSTEEDVLRSMLDWHDNPALVYARLLWEFAPKEFLKRAMRVTDSGDCAVVNDASSARNTVKPGEEYTEGTEQ